MLPEQEMAQSVIPAFKMWCFSVSEGFHCEKIDAFNSVLKHLLHIMHHLK